MKGRIRNSFLGSGCHELAAVSVSVWTVGSVNGRPLDSSSFYGNNSAWSVNNTDRSVRSGVNSRVTDRSTNTSDNDQRFDEVMTLSQPHLDVNQLDTLTPWRFKLEQSGTVIDPTGKSPEIRIVDSAGDDVVAWTSTGVSVVTFDDDDKGVEYAPASAAVADAGTFTAWIRLTSGGKTDKFPVSPKLKVVVHSVP